MLRVPAPAAVNGQQLAAELTAAGVPSDVALSGAELLVIDAGSEQKAAVQKVVAAHKPAADPTPVKPLTGEEITAVRALLNSR